jgi:hypothetical protein
MKRTKYVQNYTSNILGRFWSKYFGDTFSGNRQLRNVNIDKILVTKSEGKNNFGDITRRLI